MRTGGRDAALPRVRGGRCNAISSGNARYPLLAAVFARPLVSIPFPWGQIRQTPAGGDTHAKGLRGTDPRLRAHCAKRVAESEDERRG